MIWTLLLACTITTTQGNPPLASAQARNTYRIQHDPALTEATALAALQTWITIPGNTAAQEAVLRDIPVLRDDIIARWDELNTDQKSWIIDASARSGRPEDIEFATERWLVLPEAGRVMLVLDTPLPLGMNLIDAALTDPAPSVRIAAIRRLPLPESESKLRAQLKDPDLQVRNEARQRLGLPAEEPSERAAQEPTVPAVDHAPTPTEPANAPPPAAD